MNRRSSSGRRSGLDDLLLRSYGLSVCLFTLKAVVSAYQVDSSALSLSSGWPLYLFTLSGIGLLYAGANRWLMLLSGVLAARCLISNHCPEEKLLWFPAAEWALYVGLPLLSWVAQNLERRAQPRAPERASALQMSWRAALISAMSFAALHKLNGDFFTLELSCIRLSELLTRWWGISAALYDWIAPWMIVVAEGGLALLLWARPRLGLMVAALIFAHFGSIGATAFATLMFGMSMSFLSPSDLRRLKRIACAHRRSLSCLTAFVALGSYLSYQGPYSWPQYGLFHAGVSVTVALLALLLLRRGLGQRAPKGSAGVRWAYVCGLLWTLNGLSPYLGLKFQYSFAMLSNLRVDDSRWNSYLFPRSTRLTQYDDFVFIVKVEYRDRVSGRLLRGGALTPSLVSVTFLKRLLSDAASLGEELRVVAQYRGQRFDGLKLRPEAILPWLEGLGHNPLIQDRQPFTGAQGCRH